MFIKCVPTVLRLCGSTALPPDVAPVSARLRARMLTPAYVRTYVDYVDVFSLAWRCEGRPPLPVPHHLVCVETFYRGRQLSSSSFGHWGSFVEVLGLLLTS